MVNGAGESLKVFHHMGTICFDHGLPRAIIWMDRHLPHNDQATSSFGPAPVIGHVAVVQPAFPGKIGAVRQKTDAIGKGFGAKFDGTEEIIKHGLPDD